MSDQSTSSITRAEHLAWCKQRALEYLPADPTQAMASMMSDLGKHTSTQGHAGIQLGAMLMMTGGLSTPAEMQRFIEGFN